MIKNENENKINRGYEQIVDKTVANILPVILLFVLLGIFFSFNILTERRYENEKIKRLILIFGIVYLGWIIGRITILGRTGVFPRKCCLIPFYSYYKFLKGWQVYRLVQNIQNVLMFVPLGFLGSIVLEKNNKKERILKLLILGQILSVSIECYQYINAIGVCEADDVIHNVLGTVLGYLVYEFLYCLKIGDFKTAICLVKPERRKDFYRITRVLCVFVGVYMILFFIGWFIHLYHVYVLWQ